MRNPSMSVLFILPHGTATQHYEYERYHREGTEAYRPGTFREIKLELLIRFRPPKTHGFKLAPFEVR